MSEQNCYWRLCRLTLLQICVQESIDQLKRRQKVKDVLRSPPPILTDSLEDYLRYAGIEAEDLFTDAAVNGARPRGAEAYC